MTKIATFVLGHRDFDNQDGVFISPNADASTASEDQMSLYVTTLIPQIAMAGVVSPPFPLVLPHMIGFAPIVLPNLVTQFSSIVAQISAQTGYIRPFDMLDSAVAKSQVKSEATQLTFIQNGGKSLQINYFAYTIRAP